MARIAGIDLPENKKIDYALTLIYGIGWERARNILKEADVSGDTRTGKLSEEEVAKIAKAVETYSVEGDLKREVRQNIQRLRDIGSYRRTRNNARTKRGLRKTVVAFKKEALTKMTTAKPATNKK